MAEVDFSVDGVSLTGALTAPEASAGVVVFAHGSGSGRHSPRNRFVAEALNERGFATFLFDLLTEEEERLDAATGHLRFDIGLLADRLSGATEWVASAPEVAALPLGLFGASTGAAAALVVAAHSPERVAAIVSRGGRPDMPGGEVLGSVRAPTLFVVGGDDTTVIELNQQAYELLDCAKELEIVPGASHLFEEPGALEEVARLAGDWFSRHLAAG